MRKIVQTVGALGVLGLVATAASLTLDASAQDTRPKLCEKGTDKARIDCLVGEVGKLIAANKDLRDEIQKAAAPKRFKLANEQAGGQCLKWVDNNAPPFTLSCDHEYQVWKMLPMP